MRVLICDDHAVFAESLAMVLAEQGYDIAAVTYSLDEAIDALCRQTMDLCILDVSFPSGSIVTRLDEVRSAAPDTDIVLLSENIDVELVDAGLAAGIKGFAHKEGHITDVVSTMTQVRSGKVVVDPHLRARPARTPKPSIDVRRLASFLTSREREVLHHLVYGEGTKTLARALDISWATARSHIQSILTKLGAHSRLEAVAIAVRHGLVDIDTGEWILPDDSEMGTRRV